MLQINNYFQNYTLIFMKKIIEIHILVLVWLDHPDHTTLMDFFLCKTKLSVGFIKDAWDLLMLACINRLITGDN